MCIIKRQFPPLWGTTRGSSGYRVGHGSQFEHHISVLRTGYYHSWPGIDYFIRISQGYTWKREIKGYFVQNKILFETWKQGKQIVGIHISRKIKISANVYVQTKLKLTKTHFYTVSGIQSNWHVKMFPKGNRHAGCNWLIHGTNHLVSEKRYWQIAESSNEECSVWYMT